jgi:hypothetical protein
LQGIDHRDLICFQMVLKCTVFVKSPVVKMNEYDDHTDVIVTIVILLGLLEDLLVITLPRTVSLTNDAGLRHLSFLYDWDTALLPDNGTVFVSSPINLCTKSLPCALHLIGGASGVLELSEDAQFLCFKSTGCMSIFLASVDVKCRKGKSVFVMQGSHLNILNSNFYGCHSDTDGGVILSYDLAVVDIEGCNFTNVYSSGFGGAVAAYGSSVSVHNSWFHNCSSKLGGGAVWSSLFQDCYGSKRVNNTYLQISSSVFSYCTSGMWTSIPFLVDL